MALSAARVKGRIKSLAERNGMQYTGDGSAAL